jgi:hypothetical protein
MTKEEKVCIECGTKVGGDQSTGADLMVSLVSALFYMSILATVGSMFISHGPSLILCLMITSALMFGMRSAKDGAPTKVKKR